MKPKYLLGAILVAGMLASPLWLRLNFQNFQFGVPDSLSMLPVLFLPFSAVMIASLFILMLLTKQTRIALIVCFFFLTIFPILQWPTIFGWDQYLHTYITSSLIRPTASLNLYTMYGPEYPSSFDLIGILNVVSGIDMMILAVFLAVLVKAVTLVFVYLISRFFLKKEFALVAAFVFLLSNFRFVDYFQYSPQALAFALFLMLIYFQIKPRAWGGLRSHISLGLVLAFSVIISHIFTSVLMILTFFSIYFVQYLNRPHDSRKEKDDLQNKVSLGFLIIITLIWISWQSFSAPEVLNQAFSQLGSIFRSGLPLQSLLGRVLTFGRGASNTIILNYRQYSLGSVVLTGLAGLVVMFRRRK
jgi:hypothetical protein